MPPKKLDETKYSIPTQLIHGKSLAAEWDYTHHVNPPISASSTFRLGSAKRGAEGFDLIGVDVTDQPLIYVYPRMGEPNIDMLQSVLAVAECGEGAVVFASGMAAVHAAVGSVVAQGDEIISHKMVYGCTYSLFSSQLTRFGVTVTYADLKSVPSLSSLISAKTRVVYLESPVNPHLELLDIDAIVSAVKRANRSRPVNRRIITIMDNTFATPYAQRPLTHGVDMVVHSLTKGLSGFGAILGGAVVTRKEFIESLLLFRKDYGAILPSQSAWTVLTYGLSTLSLRVHAQLRSAGLIARFLEHHPKVSQVRYPGLPSFPQYRLARKLLRDYHGLFAPGFMIYFVLEGRTPNQAKKRGERLMDLLAERSYTITLAVSLGHMRTLIEHPGSMTHASYPAAEQIKRGIDPGGIRLAVGLEETADIINDLTLGLRKV